MLDKAAAVAALALLLASAVALPDTLAHPHAELRLG